MYIDRNDRGGGSPSVLCEEAKRKEHVVLLIRHARFVRDAKRASLERGNRRKGGEICSTNRKWWRRPELNYEASTGPRGRSSKKGGGENLEEGITKP